MNWLPKTLRIGSLARFGVLLLALSSVAVFADAAVWPLHIDGSQVSGSQVLVSVSNPSVNASFCVVGVEAVVADVPIWGFGPATLAPGQSGVLSITFPGPVQHINQIVVR